MTSTLLRLWVAGSWWTVAVASQPAPPPAPDEPTEMPVIGVTATPPRQTAETTMSTTQARTTLGDATLRRRQPDSVFQLMDDVPGVTVQGGPRNSGMGFNVRGYSDNEDVRIALDGVTKGFEKYRFGGTFIEPELLKAIEVRRGAQIDTAGALGGTVRATTRDARDLLRPGQQWGSRARIGHASNNGELHRFAAAYGRPTADTDAVVALSDRQGDNLRLASGQRLPLSEVHAGSHLLKGSWWATDTWKLSVSWVGYRDQGLQAYDTYSGAVGQGSTPIEQVGSFGQVQRRIDDDTLSVQANWADESGGHAWQTTLGRSETRVRDHFEPGWSIFSTGTQVDDDVRQTHHTLDSQLTLTTWRGAGRDALALRTGVQVGHSAREARRVTGIPALNQALYPDGYNPAQPPGSKRQVGGFVQLDWQVGRWQLLPGVRFDRTEVEVQGANAQRLRDADQADRVRYTDWSPSLTLSYTLQPGRWTAFATAARAHRPPLIDEAFMRGGYGACNNNALLRTRNGQPGVPGYSPGAQVAPASGICAPYYEPESSREFEWGIHSRHPGLLGADSVVQTKLTAFVNHTDDILESLMAEPGGSGRLIQPGWERRRGIELEAGAAWQGWQTRLVGTRLTGTQFDGLQTTDLIGIPADRVHLSLMRQTAWGEWGLRWQHVWSRRYYTDTARTNTAEAPSYRLLGASMRWRLNRQFEATVTADNLNNTRYLLDNGMNGGPGTEGPGRNLKLSLSAQY